MNLRHDDAAEGAGAITHSTTASQSTVLVVDDSGAFRDVISFVLRSGGYRVLEAEDGLEAQLVLLNERPNLVISDLEMPASDGWDVLTYCHAQQPETPVLIVSGVSPGRRPEIERWASGFLPKPCSIQAFRSELRRLAPLSA